VENILPISERQIDSHSIESLDMCGFIFAILSTFHLLQLFVKINYIFCAFGKDFTVS